MAWRWQIASPIGKATNDARVQADIKYYDDANVANTPTPTVFLHAQSFFFDPAWANADMQAAIVQEGQRARAAYTRASALNTAFSAGTTGAVP